MSDTELMRHRQMWETFTNFLFWGAVTVAALLVILLLTLVNGMSWLTVIFLTVVIVVGVTVVRSLI